MADKAGMYWDYRECRWERCEAPVTQSQVTQIPTQAEPREQWTSVATTTEADIPS